jgi:hypothetical protein
MCGEWLVLWRPECLMASPRLFMKMGTIARTELMCEDTTAAPLGQTRESDGQISRVAYLLLVGLTLLQMIGCSPAARQGAVNAIGAAGAGAAPSRQQKLMLFGGEGHKVYLGCLNCSQYSTDSVFNQYGTFGSRYSNTSVWNHYSDYGSAYSSWGACNPYATDPPVIVDLDGNFYGRLTLNEYHAQIGTGRNYHDWLYRLVCEK